MTLTTCIECGKEVSDQADACPHCGFSPAQNKHPRSRGPVILLLCMVAVMLGSGLVSECQSREANKKRGAQIRQSLRPGASKNFYTFNGSYSTEARPYSGEVIKVELEIFNLSDSEPMTIDIMSGASYTTDGNTYVLSGPEDANGNTISTSIAPGKSKTVYYRHMRSSGTLSGTIGITFSYWKSGWSQRSR